MMPGTRTNRGETMLGAVAAALQERKAEGWLVGGSVRDRELGRFSPDIDVVVTGDASAISREAARRLGLPWFTLSEEHRAYRVVGEHDHLDVAAARGGDIQSDLAERDFTINAMARPIGAGGALGGLIDPHGGLPDLRAGRLAAVSAHIFSDDPLRLMRAARFSHVFNLDIDAGLRAAVRAQAAQIVQAAAERTAAEMVLTLDAGRAGDAARLWHDLGLLHALLPEAGAGDGTVPSRPAPDALFAALDRLEESLANGGIPAARLEQSVDGAFSRATALRLAGVLAGVPAEKIGRVARRLKLSSPMMSFLATAARMSGWGALPSVTPAPDRPGREAVLFLWAAAPWEPEVLVLATAADGGATTTAAAQALLETWQVREAPGARHLPFDGNGLMSELGLDPGPRLGAALRAARLSWEAGEAGTAEEALAAARAALE